MLTWNSNITEGIHGQPDPDGGGKTHPASGRLPHPDAASADQSRGKIPQEDPEEDQKQGRFFNLTSLSSFLLTLIVFFADLRPGKPPQEEGVHGPAGAPGRDPGVGEPRLPEARRVARGRQRESHERAGQAAGAHQPAAGRPEDVRDLFVFLVFFIISYKVVSYFRHAVRVVNFIYLYFSSPKELNVV